MHLAFDGSLQSTAIHISLAVTILTMLFAYLLLILGNLFLPLGI